MMRTALFILVIASSLAAQQSPRLAAFQGGGPLLGQAEDVGAPPMGVRWTYKASEDDQVDITSAATIVGGVVYFGDGNGVLHAVDLKSGQAKWKYESKDSFATTPLVMNGKVMLGDLTGTFHCVSAEDGKKLWTLDAGGGMHASANAFGDKVLVGTDAAEVICVTLEGKELWRARGGDRINAAPSIGRGLAYFTGCDAQLRAIDLEKGVEKFTADLGALSGGSPAFVQGEDASKDRIVAATDQGRVVCLSGDGKTVHWEYKGVEAEAMVYASPSIADGVVVVGARDRYVHAIELATGKPKWKFRTRGDVEGPAA